jgi:hypothetical protein
MRRVPLRFTAWLLLVACSLSSLAPSQALVLCLEADGSAGLERAGLCEGCPDEALDGGSEVESAPERAGCPCIDIPLSRTSGEPEVAAKPLELTAQAPAAVPAPDAILTVPGQGPRDLPLIARDRPRPALQLALIRTVILRV